LDAVHKYIYLLTLRGGYTRESDFDSTAVRFLIKDH